MKAEHELHAWDRTVIYTCRTHTYKRLAQMESARPVGDSLNAPECDDCKAVESSEGST